MQLPSQSFVLRPEWLLSLEPGQRTLQGAALVVRNGCIERICAAGEPWPIDLPELALPGHVVMPGLVNAHGHLAMSLLRGFADDYRLEDWLHQHIWPTEARWVGPEFVADGTELAIAEMLRSGTTCCSDMYFFPEVSAAVAARFGMRVQIAVPIIKFANAWAASADAAIHQGLELMDRYRDDPMCSVAFGPHSSFAVEPQTLRRIAVLSSEVGRPVHIHVHETAQEVADYVASHNKRPIAHLYELGLLEPGMQMIHLTQVLPEEITLLQRNGVAVVHCPQSNLRLGSGVCPVAALRKAGVTVALGTDGAASNNGLDLFRELNIALLLAKGQAADPTALLAQQALQMATLEGARALGMDSLIGSLAPGKAADVIAVDLRGPAQQPVFNPVSQLAYTGAGACVRHVWINGQPRLADGELQDFDLPDLQQRVRNWAARIAAGTQP